MGFIWTNFFFLFEWRSPKSLKRSPDGSFWNHLWLQATAWHRAPSCSLEFPSHPFPPGCSLPYSNWDNKLQLGEQKIRQVASCCVPARDVAQRWWPECRHEYFTPPPLRPHVFLFTYMQMRQPACTSSTSTPALCFLSFLLYDVHAARLLVFSSTRGFSDARGLIIESEYSYREDGSQNHEVTWNKSSLAISVSLITPCQVLRVGMRRRPGAVSGARLGTRAQRSHFPELWALSIKLAAGWHWFSLRLMARSGITHQMAPCWDALDLQPVCQSLSIVLHCSATFGLP